MKLLERILNPNKELENKFKEIGADKIATGISPILIMSIAQFYQFREELITKLIKHDKTIMKKLKRRDFFSSESAFGLSWIIRTYEDVYGVEILLKESN